MFVGIDYGSKLAGTTVICYEKNGLLHFRQSEKKRSADELILSFVREYQPMQLFIDAPLSLPQAFFGKGDDFFYREADRAVNGMSPMFLGGLTARAMKLDHQLLADGVSCFEAYPAALAKSLDLKSNGYKDGKYPTNSLTDLLTKTFKVKLIAEPKNWHQFDSLLAWIVGLKYQTGEARQAGNPEEGLIYY